MKKPSFFSFGSSKGKKSSSQELDDLLEFEQPGIGPLPLVLGEGEEPCVVESDFGIRVTELAPYPDSPERQVGTVVIGYYDNSAKANRFTDGIHPSPRYHDSLCLLAGSKEYDLGFAVQKGWGKSAGDVWLRDIQIVLEDGSFLFPYCDDDHYASRNTGGPYYPDLRLDMDYCTKAMLAPDSYLYCPEHLDFDRVPLKVFGTMNLVREAEKAALRAKHPCYKGKTCIEGGNLLVASRRDGRIGAIIGEASLIQSVLALEAQGAFDERDVKERKRLFKKSWHQHAYLLERLGAAVNHEHGPSELFRVLLDDPIVVEKQGKKPKKPKQEKPFVAKQEHLVCYLAKRDITIDHIAAELGLPRECLTFVEQPAFHLDMAMAVGPDGIILVQGYSKARDFLAKLLRVPRPFDPDSHHQRKKNIQVETGKPRIITRKNIKHYYTCAARLAVKLADIEQRICEQLAQAGYRPQLVAGAFAEQADRLMVRDASMPINFFNNISGTRVGKRKNHKKSKPNTMFYITNGTGCDEENLGDLFRTHWWENVLEPLGYDVAYFIANLDGTAQASLSTSGGLRCLTTVLPIRLGQDHRVFLTESQLFEKEKTLIDSKD